MNIGFIVAQALAIIGWFFLIYSYYKDDIRKLLQMQIVACSFNTASYIALGAYSGVFVCMLDLIKAILYYKSDKKSLIFFATLPLYAILAVFSIQEEGPIALLPAIGGIIDGFVLTRNKTTATIGSIIASSLWVIYDLVVFAYAAAIADSILITSNFFVLVLGYSRMLHINKLHVVKCHHLTRSLSTNMLSFDRANYDTQYIPTIDEQRNLFKLNPDSITLIYNKKRPIGYISYIPITEEAYKQIKNAHVFHRNVSPDSVTTLRRRRKNYMLLESICIKESYESEKMAAFIAKHFRTILRNKHHQGYNIHGIVSIGISNFEKLFLESTGFTHIKDYRDNEALYELDDIAISKFIK